MKFSKTFLGILIAASVFTFNQAAEACRNYFTIRAQNGNHQFNPGKQWATCSGYTLKLQNDGNLVLYDRRGRSRWSSNTAGHPNARFVVQRDGNLVIYGGRSRTLWSSNTAGHPNAEFRIQEDGNLVVYGNRNRVLWSSNTGR